MIYAFLLIGQSNMAGRGDLNAVAPICDSRIKMLRNGLWVPMSEPVQCDVPWTGVSLGPSFAQCWLNDHPDDEIGFVPCAHGGTTLAQWQPGEPLFENAVFQTHLALRNSTLAGILWHQGESDSPSVLANTYGNRFFPVFTEFRKRLSAEKIPFLVGGLGDYLENSTYLECSRNYSRINAALRDFAEKAENCYFVSSAGLACNPDILHFSAVSQRLLGRRFYAAYVQKKSIDLPLSDEQAYVEKCISGKVSPEERVARVLRELYSQAL